MSEIVQVANKKPEAKRENKATQMQKTELSQSISSPVEQILFLQRTIGNQSVQVLIKSGALQAKLKIGPPGDKYEQEADRVADAVMWMPEPQVRRQPIEEEEEEEELRRQPIEEEEELQAKTASGTFPEVQPYIESHIHSLKGGGQPLSENERTFFEPRFYSNFSGVRVHTDARASEVARGVNAQAFTIGKDIVFRTGQYAPETRKGRELLAHELTHVLQQANQERGIQREWSGEARLSDSAPQNLDLDMSPNPQLLITGMSVTFSIIGMNRQPTLSGGYMPFPRPVGIRVNRPDGSLQVVRRASTPVELEQAGEYVVVGVVEVSQDIYAWVRRTATVLSGAEVESGMLGRARERSYSEFRGGLLLQDIQISGGAISGTPMPRGTPEISGPRITTTASNPSPPYSAMPFSVVPARGAARFHWYAFWQDHSDDRSYATESYGNRRVTVDGEPAFDLGEERNARFTASISNVYRIICRQYFSNGQPAEPPELTHRQVVMPQRDRQSVSRVREYIERVDVQAERARSEMVPARAMHLEYATGQQTELALYLTLTRENGRTRATLFDFTPGAARDEYTRDTVEEAIDLFAEQNSYPEGAISFSFGRNRMRFPPQTRRIETHGASSTARTAGGFGWASLGLAGVGIVLALIPGTQAAAPYFFIAAAGTGGVSAGLSLYDRLQQATPDPLGITLDILGIASSIIGGAQAFRAIRSGGSYILGTMRGRMLMYTSVAIDGVSAVMISIEGFDQIARILDSDATDQQKTFAILRVLANIALTGGLAALGAREITSARSRIASHMWERNADGLSANDVHILTLIDDASLASLRGATTEQMRSLAMIARLEARLANRLLAMHGRTLLDHTFEESRGLLRINGQVELVPSRIAAMSGEDFRAVLQVSHELRTSAGGEVSRLSAEAQAHFQRLTRGAGRIRFEPQLRGADTFIMGLIDDMGLQGQEPSRARALFQDMSLLERDRLLQLYQQPPATGAPHARYQAAHYALSRGPRTVHEFANHYEFFLTELAHRRSQVEGILKRNLTTRIDDFTRSSGRAPSPSQVESWERELSREMLGQEVVSYHGERRSPSFQSAVASFVEREFGADPSSLQRVSEQAMQRVRQAFAARQRQLTGRIGARRIDPSLPDAQLAVAIRGAGEIQFGSDAAAAYHVQKHYSELPPTERPGINDVDEYLSSVRETIRTGTLEVGPGQIGGRSVHFVRQVDFQEGGRRLLVELRAIVIVTDDGAVLLATYGGRSRIRR